MKSNRNQKRLMQSSLLVISLAGSLPCQAATFNTFNSTNASQFNHVSATSSSSVAPVNSPTTFAPVAPVRTFMPVNQAPANSVMSPISGTVMAPINPGLRSPIVGTFSPTSINQVMTTQTNINAPVNQGATAGLGAVMPTNFSATFGDLGNLGGGGKIPAGLNFADNGLNSPFHSISVMPVLDGAKGGSEHSLSPVIDNATSVVDNVTDHTTDLGHDRVGLGPVHAIERTAGNTAKHGVHVVARTVNDKRHRPQDNSENHPLPGFPGSGSSFTSTVGSVSSVIIGVQQQSQLTLFSAANQFLQGARGQVLAGDPGTILSQEQDVIILHKGRLAVSSGETTTVVKTAKCEVKLSPSTVAIIDDQTGKPLHVIALYGKDDAVSVSQTATRGSAVSAKPGQELIVADNGEEMIPVDSREVVVSGGVEIRAGVKKNDISVTEMVEQYKRRAGRFAQLAGASSSNSADTSAAQARKKRTDDIWNLLDGKASTPMQIVAQPGAQIQQDEQGNVKLLYGTLFLAARSNSVIHTASATVNLKRNGLSMMETDGSICRIKSFSGPGDLQVASADSAVDLAPGEEWLIADHEAASTEINPADAIARRTRSQEQSEKGLHCVLNDFSICSMLHYPGYRKMIAQADPSGKLAEKLLKTAVVVDMVTRGHGTYAYSSLYQQQVAENKQQLSNAETKNGKAAQ